ncbi:cation-translocating P-type ATPase [Rhodococcus xishaensis]|uniref:Cation-translocating P-type ATPase n=1 Tax=Rhodococcus xishaensis TaxID=2487364 RepID=A0A438AVG4_9NOCA|nr:cation-translocating P-type ATPase [Rhodococcus xishaensis]RVW02711.1 cation-translocating P-type ATPase [Rhodococcus xishaensis]
MRIAVVGALFGQARTLSGRGVTAAVTTVTVSTATTAGVLTALLTSGRPTHADAAHAERAHLESTHLEATRRESTTLPQPPAWSDAVLAARAAALAAQSAGFGLALAGRVLRLPRLPLAAAAPATIIDYQPRLRGLLESAIGPQRTDAMLSLANAATYAAAQAPTPLAVEALLRASTVGEVIANRAAWHRSALPPFAGDDPRPNHGPVERHLERAAWAQLGAAAAVGVATGSVRTAGTAALVAAPKAARTARESFAATLGRGLAANDILIRGPHTLRRLDSITALVVEPRALLTAELRVSRIRGVSDARRAEVWESARSAVEAGELTEGWHALAELPDPDASDAAEPAVLVSRVHDPLATAVLEQTRHAEVTVHSLDDEALGSLRSAFDVLRTPSTTTDSDLAAIVRELRDGGATVAVLATHCPDALTEADLGIGISDEAPVECDLLVPDLEAAWRVLRALPAARTASRRGIEIATGASLLGSLLMLPGTHGRGPGPISAGSGAALWTGHSLAHGVLRADAPTPLPQHDWHAMPADQVRRMLATPAPQGPPSGPGRLESLKSWVQRPAGFLWDFGQSLRTELSDPLTPILATGSAASAVLGSPVDAVLVGSVLVGNAALSAAQRLHAERLLRRLLAVQDPPARILSADGGYRSIPSALLHPGEVIEVRPGEVVPADGRLLTADAVEVDESSLTGESLPVDKQIAATPGVPLADRTCMLYAGTTVLTGTATAVVTTVGAATETGRAAALSPRRVGRVGLQAQLRELTGQVLPVSVASGALVTLTSMLRGGGLQSAITSGVAVAVAAVPEGLPLVATLAQQAAAQRLTRASALVRSPRSVEALGRVDVACFDKTGTLSEDRLRVRAVRAAASHHPDTVLRAAARTSVTVDGVAAPHATDRAVVEAAEAATLGDRPLEPDDVVLPFRSGRPYAAALKGTELVVKGAPEVVLAACTGAAPSKLEGVVSEVPSMAEHGMRVIAVARRVVTPAQAARAVADPDEVEVLCGHGLEPLGLLGLSDTIRPEAADLLPSLEERGVSVRLITGDHPVTAAAIARNLGLELEADDVVSGSEWEALSHRGQEIAVRESSVFARMTPEQKVQIVQTLERTGHVCAMVGDGANDAAAIRAASIGIGVASRGSHPARSAADLLLLDGHVDAILDAIDEGRQLWQRVQAAVSVLLGGNAGEVAFALIGSAISGRAPLGARQLLLVNLLTDALPAAALAVSPLHQDRAHHGRGPDKAALWRTVAIRGATTAAGASVAWGLASVTGRPRRASTVGLVALVGTQLGQTLIDSHSPLVVATALGSLGVLGAVVTTPGVSQFLGCTPLGPLAWAQALGSATGATAVAAVAPRALAWWGDRRAQSDQSTTSTPALSSKAYAWRNGGASTDVTTPVNGSGPGERTDDVNAESAGSADNETVTGHRMATLGVHRVNNWDGQGER